MRQMTMSEFLKADDLKDGETVAITDGPQPLFVTSDNRLARQWFQSVMRKQDNETEH